MSDYHFLGTKHYLAEVSACTNKVLRIEIKDGCAHAASGAFVSQEPVPSRLTETEKQYAVCTGKVRLEIDKEDGGLRFYDKNGTLLVQTYPEAGYEKKEDGFKISFQMRDSEHIYGLGEDNDVAFGRLNRRGSVRDLLTGQRINQNHVTADFPIPLILSAGGVAPYGIYIDNTSNLTVDIGKTIPDKLGITAPAGGAVFYFMAGESLPEIVCGYSKLTGAAKLPPLWVLGYMQSKCSFWNWEEIDDVILTFKERGIPLDSVVFDFDWAQYFNNYQWNERWEGKSPEKIREYREAYGIHFMASNSGPMLKKDSDTYASAEKAGILAHDTDGNTVTCGHYSGELMDFTNPATEQWIAPQLERIMEDGVESWWLDLTEPEGDAENTVYYAGSRAEVHNIFSNAVSETYHRVMKKAAPGKRSFVLTRTGTAGIQRNATALWTGDIYSEYGTLQAHIPEALNTQLSGVPMWTCDTGGFLSPTNNDACPYNLYHNDRVEHGALYERWMQFSCFTPVFRAHHAGGEAVPFRYQDITFDGMARYIRLRYQLIPYIYSLYYENHLTGTPIMRPLFWHYPEDAKAFEITDEYLFGEKLLVAPVLEAQKNCRKVYFPEGSWYDFDYGYVYEGGQEYEVYAPQNRIPVFVKAGAVLPVSRSVENTRELDFTRLEALVYPEGSSCAYIYADDGETEGYLAGDYTRSKIRCEETEDRLVLAVGKSNDKYALKELTLHIHMKKAPKGLLADGTQLRQYGRETGVRHAVENAYYFDEFNRMLHVKLLFDGECRLEIELDYERSYRAFEPFSEEKLAGQLPYIYPAAAIPSVIQAIHYDRGGEGVAFHKHTADTPGVYRDDSAGIAQGKKGCYISELSEGEWLEYSISGSKEGNYRIVLEGNTAQAAVEVSVGENRSEICEGAAVLSLGTGQMVLRVEVLRGKVDLEQIKIEKIE